MNDPMNREIKYKAKNGKTVTVKVSGREVRINGQKLPNLVERRGEAIANGEKLP